jgi:hypothetical protein
MSTPMAVELSSAWPQVPIRAWDAGVWNEVAAAPDGSIALGSALAQPLHAPIGPGIMDRSTGKVTVIRRFTNPRTQVVWIVGDADWIAWVEGSLMPSFQDWVLYSYDRHTTRIRTLASAPKPYLNTPSLMISISHGVIVWSAVEAPDGVFRVYAINADGSGLRVLAADAKGPQIVWPWVVYDVKPTAARPQAILVQQNLESGEVREIPGPTDVSYFAYDGESLAWISSGTCSPVACAPTDLFLQSPLESAPLRIASGQHLQFVSMNQRLVGWGQPEGARVYDRKLRLIIQLSSLHGFYPVISAQALDWLYRPNPNASNPYEGAVRKEVNVSDLP